MRWRRPGSVHTPRVRVIPFEMSSGFQLNAGGEMRFSLVDSGGGVSSAATICRISALGTRWRVRVESWRGGDGWSGRLVFEPDSSTSRYATRLGPPTLQGRNQMEVLDEVYSLSEQRLRELLNAYG